MAEEGGLKNLAALMRHANWLPRDVPGMSLSVDLRRKLLGEFLELDEIRAAMWGHYDMESGVWALRTANRRRFIISARKD